MHLSATLRSSFVGLLAALPGILAAPYPLPPSSVTSSSASSALPRPTAVPDHTSNRPGPHYVPANFRSIGSPVEPPTVGSYPSYVNSRKPRTARDPLIIINYGNESHRTSANFGQLVQGPYRGPGDESDSSAAPVVPNDASARNAGSSSRAVVPGRSNDEASTQEAEDRIRMEDLDFISGIIGATETADIWARARAGPSRNQGQGQEPANTFGSLPSRIRYTGRVPMNSQAEPAQENQESDPPLVLQEPSARPVLTPAQQEIIDEQNDYIRQINDLRRARLAEIREVQERQEWEDERADRQQEDRLRRELRATMNTAQSSYRATLDREAAERLEARDRAYAERLARDAAVAAALDEDAMVTGGVLVERMEPMPRPSPIWGTPGWLPLADMTGRETNPPMTAEKLDEIWTNFERANPSESVAGPAAGPAVAQAM
ncbi:hypothetical protein BJ508DRAFT_311212 [Ascobolus immersus RN42]|uniref:Uncharacterized protein n=1 Tax=Ascobolus immersus RN42 TaxID=1160509 RepID=A0A3N4HUU7_ASCIM|nr:hypothetical protein BJ508DRAFT_311212 [Ascobolus immersus RN42]